LSLGLQIKGFKKHLFQTGKQTLMYWRQSDTTNASTSELATMSEKDDTHDRCYSSDDIIKRCRTLIQGVVKRNDWKISKEITDDFIGFMRMNHPKVCRRASSSNANEALMEQLSTEPEIFWNNNGTIIWQELQHRKDVVYPGAVRHLIKMIESNSESDDGSLF
jgi:hypothetical protein